MCLMKKGFTLIELLIVISIIGILAVVFLPSIMGAPEKTRDAARVADLTNVVKMIEAGRTEGVSLPAYVVWLYTNYCIDDVNLATFAPYAAGGIIPMDPDPNNELDTRHSNPVYDCKGNDSGKYMLHVFNPDPAKHKFTGGYKYAIFVKLENDYEKANIPCSYVGRANGSNNNLYDDISYNWSDSAYEAGGYCYGVKVL
ncbi:type II secretion system protein [Candidatus Peregrinibacteria bacterium]|nr:type II secretion system protein [Candidatus Peregrinibacteria bacterium]MBT4055811.1 type II secretion system protein [Candidatus Peregrinibacteria bacterium]